MTPWGRTRRKRRRMCGVGNWWWPYWRRILRFVERGNVVVEWWPWNIKRNAEEI